MTHGADVMIINLSGPAWVQVDVPGDKQITNQGRTNVRIAQAATIPTNDRDGELLSTYAQGYASVAVTGDFPCWARPVGGIGIISVQAL